MTYFSAKHISIFSIDAGWSSLVARRAHNPKVVGSNPAPATTNKIKGLDAKSKPFFMPKKKSIPTLFPTFRLTIKGKTGKTYFIPK